MLGLHRLPTGGRSDRPRPPAVSDRDARQRPDRRSRAERQPSRGRVVALTAGVFLVATASVFWSWWATEPDCSRIGVTAFDASCAPDVGR